MTTTPAVSTAPRPIRRVVRTVAVYASLADPGLYRYRWHPGRRLVGTIHLTTRRALRALRGMTAAEAIEAAAIGERGMWIEWPKHVED